ncbi:hypothetical protein J8273_5620, partial [Carpediemonas membranifera]
MENLVHDLDALIADLAGNDGNLPVAERLRALKRKHQSVLVPDSTDMPQRRARPAARAITRRHPPEDIRRVTGVVVDDEGTRRTLTGRVVAVATCSAQAGHAVSTVEAAQRRTSNRPVTRQLLRGHLQGPHRADLAEREARFQTVIASVSGRVSNCFELPLQGMLSRLRTGQVFSAGDEAGDLMTRQSLLLLTDFVTDAVVGRALRSHFEIDSPADVALAEALLASDGVTSGCFSRSTVDVVVATLTRITPDLADRQPSYLRTLANQSLMRIIM